MRLDRAQAEALLARIRGCRVAVLGDLMLDEYLFGEVDRISPPPSQGFVLRKTEN